MVIDTHAHFWNYPAGSKFRHDPPQEPISAAQLLDRMDEAGVDKVVHITRSVMGFDNNYSLEGAAQFPERIRVMGRFDFSAPAWPERLRAWLQNPLMVGIRITVLPPEDRWFADDAQLDAFWSEAEKLEIPVAIYAPGRSAMVARIAKAHPGLRLIVDHLGIRVFDIFKSPPTLEDWPQLMALKTCPNVTIKLSAIPEAMVEGPPFRRSRELILRLYERFGPARMMWGSNYPLITQVCSYQEALALVQGCEFLSAGDREQILSRTAASVLRLPW